MNDDELPPILTGKHYGAASAFSVENLLREARRQKAASAEPVPDICLLDPDGDIVRQLKTKGSAQRHDTRHVRMRTLDHRTALRAPVLSYTLRI